MRKNLESEKEARKKFRAAFSRFGKKTNYHGYTDKTVLLTQVKDLTSDRVVTDHVWFAFTKGFEDAGNAYEKRSGRRAWVSGITVEFEARIKAYKKGYVNRRYNIDQRTLDYKLSHPTKIIIIDRDETDDASR